MQVPISREEYRRLELIPSPNSSSTANPDSSSNSSPDSSPTQTQNWLSRWRDALLACFNSSSEPRVWQVNRQGQTVWQAYDPVTHRQAEFTGELELRIWLEERYYRSVCG
ncbi:MAG: hypothetical protein ACKO7W_19195 [Elainella sp.]